MILLLALLLAAPPQRARDLGIPFQGNPGPLNAITDVAGVEVGMTTLIRGDSVRTGVTIIHPTGKKGREAVAAGFAVTNGTGEFTGTRMLEEVGLFFGPIALTGTGNIAVVHQALVDWSARPGFVSDDERIMRSLPLVGETLDEPLNDTFGHPMTAADVVRALETAAGGPVPEGNVGGGTGMMAYQFKGGTGTASRVVEIHGQKQRVGVLVQSNHGVRRDLRVAGVPVGEEITDLMPEQPPPKKNSLLVIIATDAPLQAHQLARLARRASLGVGRNGGTANAFSGEFALAFSTAVRSPISGPAKPVATLNDNDEESFNALFAAVVQAFEEAEINQLVASETMTGFHGAKVYTLPKDRLRAIVAKSRQAP